MKKRECSNCRYRRRNKELWCKCTGLLINNIEDTCDKWEEEKLIKICDNCGKEFSEAGHIFAKEKDGLDLLLCPDCTERVCREIERILLKGVSK